MSNPFAPSVRRAEFEKFKRRRDAQWKHLNRIKREPLKYQIRALGEYERQEEKLGGLRSDDPIGIYFNRRIRPLLDRVDSERAQRRALRVEDAVARRDNLGEHSSDAAVRAWARRRAGEAVAIVGRNEDECAAYCAAVEFCRAWRIEPPPMAEGDPLGPSIARMTCVRWWRRRARRLLTLDIEQRAIAAGRVHRKAGVYVSDANVERGKAQDERNAQLLLNLVAENEEGHSFCLAELADKSLSNPHVRFSELMVRLKGMEAAADRIGYCGLFLTWTLESRYHARLSKTGAENPAWTADKLTPRDGQNRLRQLWTWARAALAKLHARYFGVRVAEPHHDGTPHWHLLLFVKPEQRAEVTAILRAYALTDSPDEPGAASVRFKVEVIDKAKGGATSYVAKYISKMTTGAGLGQMKERGADGRQRDTGGAEDGASRARRWASVHGIRQFQAFGVPPIGIWRELRRLDGPAPTEWPNGLPVHPVTWSRLENARQAADDGDYCKHLGALGGPALPRAKQKLMLLRRVHGDLNPYGELRAPTTEGVCARLAFNNARPVTKWRHNPARRRKSGVIVARSSRRTRMQNTAVVMEGAGVVTRLHTWVLKQRAEGAAVAFDVAVEREDTSQGGGTVAPWTRVNNCNRVASDQGQETGHPPAIPPPETPPWPPAASAAPQNP